MNKFIDHTYLAPDCTSATVDRICAEAVASGFYAVCIPPFFVGQAARALSGTGVKLATVVAFPYGYAETAIKVQEIRRAMEEGADELDIVINIAAVKSQDWAYVTQDLTAVATTARLKGKVSKIIIEMSELTAVEKDRIIAICNDIKPTFVKTSTGTKGGATVEDVRYLRANLHPDIKIKASGGIRNKQSAQALIEAGADRIGTSSGLSII
ncbi:deoxyribose-phosphate aldolase [Neolewinella aurantiaca]|uniref:Deoxyribose-phosphate aldolase n=1 Tax=Neolewinella aurantiaca TaxID=2602767 RepID=A0A5C7FGE1_9BACT|nr:deoxyribose-phosphate aldolase [Neolewinella aurantiaca]TXF88702.1 deoxyribose-phosphate aldolase [Neolewinella aurantiaca]